MNHLVMPNSKLLLTSAAALVFAAITALAQNPSPLLTQPVDKLVAVLKSDASLKDKAEACRELSVVGGRESIDALAALLSDEKLAHMARYGLETIPSPLADDALRAALGKLNGRLLVGVIGSLGVRQDTKAIPPLSKLLSDADADVAQASARALGKIGTAAAAKAIEDALTATPAANQLAFCEGLFRCAESAAVRGQRKGAVSIYERLRGVQGLHQVRVGALRGAVLVSPKEGLFLLTQALRGDDWVLVDAAARTALEMPGIEVTRALTAELPKLSGDKQLLVIEVLGKRGDAAALPALLVVAKQGSKPARVAAIRAIPEIRQATPAVSVLGELLADPDREIGQAAFDSLAGLPGPGVDASVMTMLNSGATQKRLAAIDLVAQRRMTTAIPALLKAANDPDAKIRPAALRRVGELGGPSDVPGVLGLLNGSAAGPELEAAEQALADICVRAGNQDASADKLTAAFSQAAPAQKSALVGVLTAVGGAKALKAVRVAATDPSPEVRASAIRALGRWETADAAPDLLALAKSAANPTDKMLCLRGYLGLAAHPDLGAEQRLALCQNAIPLIEQPDEKKLLLGALGGINSTEALALILPYLDDNATKEEAAAASVGIAENLMNGREAS